MKTLFRVDSGSKIGLGHINRCLIFAKEFKNPNFACLNLDGNIASKIKYPVHFLNSNGEFELVKLIKENDFDEVIFDSYDIDADFECKVKLATNAKIISFDDEIKAHFCDELIIPNSFIEPSEYANLVPPHCKITNKIFVRDEFYAEAKIKREKIYDFLLCLGGSDARNLSSKILKQLPPNAKIAVATTSANANLVELKKYANSNGIALFIDYENLARLMNESKELLLSASSLANEALVLGARFTAYKVASNQEKMCEFLKNKGIICYDLA